MIQHIIFHHHHSGLLMLSGSTAPVLAVAFSGQHIALGLSMIVALMAIVDYCFKLQWKISQTRARKKGHTVKLTDEEFKWIEAKRYAEAKGKN